MRPTPALLAALLFPLAGCLGGDGTPTTYAEMGFDGEFWPDLHGAKVVVLDHGAFDYAFGPAKEAFEALTNGTVEHVAAQDAGDALNRAIREKARPSFDVVYGVDNALLWKAVQEGAFQPYKPLLADRINASYVFFDVEGPWHATPVDHGYIAVNVDPRANLTVADLYDLRAHAGEFVTEDPRTSTPGLGFLLATIATFPERPGLYDWKDYWADLLEGGARVTADWTTAYTQHFTGGYGRYEEGFAGVRPIVTSYTTSPAYEVFYGSELLNQNLLADGSTFHQIQTMGIAANTRNLAAAQAWVEFTLTDAFQDLAAEYNAIYPVVDGRDVSTVYGGLDPAPGTFAPADFTYEELGQNLEGWIEEWVAVYEAARR